jgi:hypothetical protein
MQNTSQKGYIAFNLVEASREAILRQFVPLYSMVVCHHITFEFGVLEGTALPETPRSLEVVGYATDNTGVEALVVAVNGEIRRSDGKVYHVTLSLAQGRKPVQSNDVIEKFGWTPCLQLAISAEPRWNR